MNFSLHIIKPRLIVEKKFVRRIFLCLILIFHGWDILSHHREWNINKIMARFRGLFRPLFGALTCPNENDEKQKPKRCWPKTFSFLISSIQNYGFSWFLSTLDLSTRAEASWVSFIGVKTMRRRAMNRRGFQSHHIVLT